MTVTTKQRIFDLFFYLAFGVALGFMVAALVDLILEMKG